MARIRLNLKSLSITDKIAKGRQIVTAMTNNTNFPTPTPPLTEVTAAVDELAQAFAMVQSAKGEVTSAGGPACGRQAEAKTWTGTNGASLASFRFH